VTSCVFKPFLALLCLFAWCVAFRAFYWLLRFFLLLDDLLELFSAFGLLAVLHVSWIQISNFVLLCCHCTHQGGE
jgi:hypothetical protein